MRQFVAVTVLVWLVSGLGVWLVAPANTITVGASGIVFGWLAFLIVRGIWTRTWQHIVLGLVLLALYGSLFWTGIVTVAAADITGVVTVSWQAHLFGAIGGVLAAFLVGQGRRGRAGARPTRRGDRAPDAPTRPVPSTSTAVTAGVDRSSVRAVVADDAPIGIFDSGVGGLTVARAIIDQLPGERVRYVGDTANGPYGPLPHRRGPPARARRSATGWSTAA